MSAYLVSVVLSLASVSLLWAAYFVVRTEVARSRFLRDMDEIRLNLDDDVIKGKVLYDEATRDLLVNIDLLMRHSSHVSLSTALAMESTAEQYDWERTRPPTHLMPAMREVESAIATLLRDGSTMWLPIMIYRALIHSPIGRGWFIGTTATRLAREVERGVESKYHILV